MQAGLLRVRLSHIDELIGNRRHIADRYLKEIKNPKVELPLIAKDCEHTWYQFIVKVDDQDGFRQFLSDMARSAVKELFGVLIVTF